MSAGQRSRLPSEPSSDLRQSFPIILPQQNTDKGPSQTQSDLCNSFLNCPSPRNNDKESSPTIVRSVQLVPYQFASTEVRLRSEPSSYLSNSFLIDDFYRGETPAHFRATVTSSHIVFAQSISAEARQRRLSAPPSQHRR